MNKLINSILVPVSGSIDPVACAEKVVEISNHLKSKIHILYLINKFEIPSLNYGSPFFASSSGKAIFWKSLHFDSLKKYATKSSMSIFPTFDIQHESAQKAIVKYFLKHNIDLVVLFETDKERWFKKLRHHLEMSQLSKKMDCPVFSMRLHSGNLDIKNIVVPVGNMLPLRKLMFASYLGRLFRSKIHLVSLRKEMGLSERDESDCLYRAYRLIHDYGNLSVECSAIDGEDMEEAAYRYGTKIKADLMIMANPDEQNKYAGVFKWIWWRTWFRSADISVMNIGTS